MKEENPDLSVPLKQEMDLLCGRRPPGSEGWETAEAQGDQI